MLFDIYSKYEDFFHLPRAREKSDPSWFAFPLTIKENVPFRRDDFLWFLENNLIQTRPYFAGNIMLQPAYDHLYDNEKLKSDYPVATYVMKNTFFHGTSPIVTKEQIQYIGETVDKFMSMLV